MIQSFCHSEDLGDTIPKQSRHVVHIDRMTHFYNSSIINNLRRTHLPLDHMTTNQKVGGSNLLRGVPGVILENQHFPYFPSLYYFILVSAGLYVF